MNIAKTVIGIVLCLLGAVLIVFEFGMAHGEPDALRHPSGWITFSLVVVFATIIFVGGVLLCMSYRGRSSTSPLKSLTGIALCVVGILCVFFSCAEAISIGQSFFADGWIPFLVFVIFGAVVFTGGILLWKGQHRN